MKPCIACGEDAVDPDDPPRYDVLAPTSSGPYCAVCWLETITGRVAG